MDQVFSLPASTSPGFPAADRLMSHATVAVIHHALDHQLGRALDSQLRPGARMVCNDARASGLRVEQLLIALKREWGALLDSHGIPAGDARTDLTSRFITLCIYEYYAAQSPSSGSTATGEAADLHA